MNRKTWMLKTMKDRLVIITALVLFTWSNTFAQSTPKKEESHKYRTILTLAGGGGAFALGVFVGLNAFDDAVNSDRKLWTTALISAAGGAVGGYFLGRALDKRKKKTDVTHAAEEFYRALTDSQRPSGTWGLVADTRQKASQPISLLSSLQGPPIDTAGSSCDLSRLYLRAALEKINPPE